MTDHAFNDAQALYDAAEPDDDELPDYAPIGIVLEDLLMLLDRAGQGFAIEDTRPLSDRQATAAIWIDGHEYSLTLNREDG